MTKALYVIGAPGVGKSTALLHLFPCMKGSAAHAVPEYPLLKLTALGPGTAMLGVWRNDFPGTDGLSMAVLPQAVEWARCAPALPKILIGEGQRLANLRFLVELHDRPDVELTVVYLYAKAEEMTKRRAHRTQNQQWVKAASTRAFNVMRQCDEYGITTMPLNTEGAPPHAVAAWMSTFV